MAIDDEEEAEVVLRAVQALDEANRRAIAAGHPVVLVQDGKLIRREGDRVIVLKAVRGRIKVTDLEKRREP